MIRNLGIFILGGWLTSTAVVDFVAVPAVFRNLPDLFDAGKIGIVVFSKYNWLEFFFATILLFCSYHSMRRGKEVLATVVAFFLFGIAVFYLFYLTPQIAHYAEQMVGLGTEQLQELALARKKHEFYHNLYRRFDVIKILFLLSSLIFFFKPQGTRGLA